MASGIAAFLDEFLPATERIGSKIYMTRTEIDKLKRQEKQLTQQYEIEAGKEKERSKKDIAKLIFQAKQKKTEAEQPLQGAEKLADIQGDVLAKRIEVLDQQLKEGKISSQDYIDKLSMYSSYRKSDVSGMPQGGGGGGGTNAKPVFSQILKDYRSKFESDEAQKWMNDVAVAVQTESWDEFMRLGKDIPDLQIRIQQGRHGMSETVTNDINNATGFWQTIYEQLMPKVNKITQSKTPTTTPAQTYPADLPDKVKQAVDLDAEGKTAESDAIMGPLIEKYGRPVIVDIMKGL